MRGTKSIINATQSVFYFYVDDGAFASASSEDSYALMHESAVGLEGIGFRVGTKTEAQSCAKIVGYEVERASAWLRLLAFKDFLFYAVMHHLPSQLGVDNGLVR